MKKLVLYFVLISISTTVIFAKGFTGLSLGVSGGYSNKQNYNLEIFGNANFKWRNNILDFTGGVNYQPYMVNYAERKDLKVNKFSIFGDATSFLFQKNLFAGFRFEYVGNWFSKNALYTL